DLCYGCGRCLQICPSDLISAQEQVYHPEFLWQDLAQITAPSVPAPQFSPTKLKIDAIEIHTQPYRVTEFRAFWQRIAPIVPTLQLMAVSFPDCEDLEAYLRALLDCMEPRPKQLIWQTDGRPMSGDIGEGTTHAALALARKVLDFQLPFGFVQLAGGTNHSTVTKIRQHQINAAGVAYGSYGRKILAELLEQSPLQLETDATALETAVKIAQGLVMPLKESAQNRELL
ncbi:MAG: LdpA C-terminal domain-containing domain, partial [Pseudanabaena sp. ELA607]